MIGVKALSNFLYNLNSTQIAALQNGTITDKNGTLTGTANSTVATYVKSATCPTGAVTQYCFDVMATSGGASATIRMIYQKSTVGSTTLKGSVFAGGLVVAKQDTLTGNGVSISVGAQLNSDGTVKVAAGTVTTNNSKTPLSLTGITVTAYTSSTFITADSLKDSSNYQFMAAGSTCNKLNLYSGTSGTNSISPTSIDCSSFSGIGYANGRWEIDPSKTLPVGILWFQGNVYIKSGYTLLVNTIIATGSITTSTSNSGTINNYAPYYYKTLVSPSDDSKICGNASQGNVPTQYCTLDSSLTNGAKFNTDVVASFPGNISTILFLTNDTLSLDAAQNAIVNFYGNMIASYGAGGTGSASGKFTGTGTINITGNLVIAGTTDTTTMTGNIKISLGDTTAASADVIPSYTYANGLRFIKYM